MSRLPANTDRSLDSADEIPNKVANRTSVSIVSVNHVVPVMDIKQTNDTRRNFFLRPDLVWVSASPCRTR